MKTLFKSQSIIVCQHLLAFFIFTIFLICLSSVVTYSDEPIYLKTDLSLQKLDQFEQEHKTSTRIATKNRIDAFSYLSKETKELAYALASDDFDTADSLVDRVDLNTKTPLGYSFFFHCIQFGANDLTCPGRIRWLLNHGIDTTNLMIYGMHSSSLQEDGTYKECITSDLPIEHYTYYPTIVSKIIARNPEVANQKNPNTKQTALGKSATFGYTKTVELLLAFGASIDLPGKNDETPLVQSVTHSQYDVALLLISYGADANIPITVKEFNQTTRNTGLVKYENALDFLVRSPHSIEQNKDYEKAIQEYGFPDTAIKFKAKKALITLLKKLERLKQLENIQTIKSENEK